VPCQKEKRKKERNAKKIHVFFTGVGPGKNTGLHQPIGGIGLSLERDTINASKRSFG
jgi:hypothetical protein